MATPLSLTSRSSPLTQAPLVPTPRSTCFSIQASGRARRAPRRPSDPPRRARPPARHWLQGSSPSTLISLRYAPPRRSCRSPPPLPGIVPPAPVGSQPHESGDKRIKVSCRGRSPPATGARKPQRRNPRCLVWIMLRSNLHRRSYKPLLRRAGLPDIRLYDLRHTFATLMLENKEQLRLVSEMLGHASVRQTADTYTHVSPTMHREA